ncbi:YciI family protein [Maribacter sp. SA7]|uniref:YciI family protein n=1 Tax=Maribacter zhoushanensis TaxID=3030012 RepID=UPI0023ED527B|nr:YciI family protein [Maribacter zhoushanensis]MDF4203841.1 YciI family protein [Maribacter zhoushanensis]
MYIINITYKTSLEKVDEYLNQHVEYLNEQYELGNFEVSGRKVPRTGGIILATISNKKELLKIIEKDPFKTNDLADYELVEFVPSRTSKELEILMH